MIFVNPYSRVNVDFPDISLAYAATHYNAKVVDFNTDPRPYDVLLAQQSDTLGISVRSLNMGEALKIAEAYKKVYPETRIVSVGTGIDIQCCYPYRQWDDHIAYDTLFSDEYPFPDYELFDTFPIFRKKWQEGIWRYAIMTSLGCPFPCEHCMCRSRKFRPRSPENSVEELKRAIGMWGIKKFFILDDCFNANTKRAARFCEQVKDLGLPWECANGLRADLFDEKLAVLLSGAGCVQASFGIESVDNKVLKNINKAETFEQIERAVKIALKYFDNVNGFFIIGLPGSTYKSDRAGLEWARKIGLNAHFSYYVPQGLHLPNDELFYGEGARPLGDAYPHEDQQRLFAETSGMRPPVPTGTAPE